MLFNLFSKKLSQEEIKTPEKLIQQELKEERVERMVKNFERRISLMNHSIHEYMEDRNDAIAKGSVELAAEKEASIQFFRDKLEEIRKEFQKEILELV